MKNSAWGMLVFAMLAGVASTPAVAQNAFDRDVLSAVNRARTQPLAVAAELRRYRHSFDGLVVREGDDPIGIQSVEGVRAVDEAIAFLEEQEPLPPLDEGPVLARAAQGWAETQGRSGALGHRSPASGSPGERVRAAGGDIYVGETISYGMTTPAAVVRQLIVDDGQPGRGHRTMLFSRSLRFAGVGCGEHARFGTMCVIDLAATIDGGPALPRIAAVQPVLASAFRR